MAGGTGTGGVARWDGTHWHRLGTGVSCCARALTVYDGKLIAGGYFTTAGGGIARGIAQWNGATWRPLGRGMTDISYYDVYALTVSNENLIVGGNFGAAGGTNAAFIAQWNGTEWQPLGSGVNGGVSAIMVYNGEVIAGGWFTVAGDNVSAYWARWGPTGPSPTITQQPQRRIVSPGGTATFTVGATGSGVLAYRWRKNDVDLADGGNVAGAETATLTVSNIGPADAGLYDCLVTNDGCGVAVSRDAALVVANVVEEESVGGARPVH